jgi:hypothetical protein
MNRKIQVSPDGVIENIRSLLREGYGDSSSLVKELIQNAEDAGANKFIIKLIAGDPSAEFELLRPPAICVINDGPINRENINAMFLLGSGTKASEKQQIGKFGRGLKSVFSYSETFFVLHKESNFSEHSNSCGETHEFCNPWSGLNREGWDITYDKHSCSIASTIWKRVNKNSENNIVLLYLPLRQSFYRSSKCNWLYPNEIDDLESLQNDIKDGLKNAAKTLPLLKNIETLSFINEINNTSVNIKCTYNNPNDANIVITDSKSPIKIIRANINRKISKSDYLANLRQDSNWPKMLDNKGNDVPIKAEQETALIILQHPYTEIGQLKTHWAVFLPIKEHPQGTSNQKIKKKGSSTELVFHSYTFLDSRRVMIDGLQNAFTDSNNSIYIQWNRELIQNQLLPTFPKVIFETISCTTDLEAFIEAFKESWEWKNFNKSICKVYKIYKHLTVNGTTWQLIENAKPDLTHVVPNLSSSTLALLLQNFPQFKNLINNRIIVTESDYEISLASSSISTSDKLDLYPDDAFFKIMVRGIQETQVNESWDDVVKWFKKIPDNHSSWQGAFSNIPLIKIKKINGQIYWISKSALLNLTESHNPPLLFDDTISSDIIELFDDVFKSGPALLRLTKSDIRLHKIDNKVTPSILSSLIEVIRKFYLVDNFKPRELLLSRLFKDLGTLSKNNTKALRYLIHGLKEKYDNDEILFSSISDEDSKLLLDYFKLCNNKDIRWRFIRSEFNNILSPSQRAELLIEEVNAKSILKALYKEGINYPNIDSIDLTFDDSEKLLKLFAQASDNDIKILELPLFQPLFGTHLTSATESTLLYSLKTFDIYKEIIHELALSNNYKLVRSYDNAITRNIIVELFKGRELTTKIILEWIANCDNTSGAEDLIRHCINYGVEIESEIKEKISSKRWIKLKNGKYVKPDDVLRIPNSIKQASFVFKLIENAGFVLDNDVDEHYISERIKGYFQPEDASILLIIDCLYHYDFVFGIRDLSEPKLIEDLLKNFTQIFPELSDQCLLLDAIRKYIVMMQNL